MTTATSSYGPQHARAASPAEREALSIPETCTAGPDGRCTTPGHEAISPSSSPLRPQETELNVQIILKHEGNLAFTVEQLTSELAKLLRPIAEGDVTQPSRGIVIRDGHYGRLHQSGPVSVLLRSGFQTVTEAR